MVGLTGAMGGGLGALHALSPLHRAGAVRGYSSAAAGRSAVKHLHSNLVDAMASLERLRDELEPGAGLRPVSKARVQGGSGSLNLSTVNSVTSIQSSEEVNNATGSYAPDQSEFAGFSSASITIGGDYRGEIDQTLRVEVRSQQVGDEQRIQLHTFHEDGTLAGETWLENQQDPSQIFQLAEGLTVSFGKGTIVNGDVFEIAVSTAEAPDLDPDAQFNGAHGQDPNFDWKQSVQAGSFEINESLIDVHDDDTVNSVLQRITDTVKGFSAHYNAESERVEFVADNPGANHSIVFGEDSSGFLAAMKLSNAEVIAGSKDERHEAIADVAAFNGVTGGSFSINGESISFDRNDSLVEILNRINTSDARVTAQYKSGTGQVVITHDVGGADLTLDEAGTGLFTALGIETGTHVTSSSPAKHRGRSRRGNSQEAFNALEDVQRKLNQLFAQLERPEFRGQALSNQVRETLVDAVRHDLDDEATQRRTRYGFRFMFDAGTGAGTDPFVDFGIGAETRFRRAFVHQHGAMAESLVGDEDDPGVITRLIDAMSALDGRLRNDHGSSGVRFHSTA